MLVFSRRTSSNGASIIGDWYGWVSPEWVPTVVRAARVGKIVLPLWRGAMGLDAVAMKMTVAESQDEFDEALPPAKADEKGCASCDKYAW